MNETEGPWEGYSATRVTSNRRFDCCWEVTRLHLQPRMFGRRIIEKISRRELVKASTYREYE